MDRFKLIQQALARLGYPVGPADGIPGPLYDEAARAFQAARGLEIDGIVGPITEAALFGRPVRPEPPVVAEPGSVPLSWMPACRMTGIVVHWTAGSHRATDFDRRHYHLLIEGSGRLVRGIPPIDANAAPIKPGYAAHTLNRNGGMIGVSLCCMGGAVDSPFASGPFPTTRAQWDALPPVLADLCRRYGIAVTRRTVLSHAEVQPTLGVAQRGKWDIARLAFDLSVVGPIPCGDIFRARTAALLQP